MTCSYNKRLSVKVDGFDCDLDTPEGTSRFLHAWLNEESNVKLRDVHDQVFKYILELASRGYIHIHTGTHENNT